MWWAEVKRMRKKVEHNMKVMLRGTQQSDSVTSPKRIKRDHDSSKFTHTHTTLALAQLSFELLCSALFRST